MAKFLFSGVTIGEIKRNRDGSYDILLEVPEEYEITDKSDTIFKAIDKTGIFDNVHKIILDDCTVINYSGGHLSISQLPIGKKFKICEDECYG